MLIIASSDSKMTGLARHHPKLVRGSWTPVPIITGSLIGMVLLAVGAISIYQGCVSDSPGLHSGSGDLILATRSTAIADIDRPERGWTVWPRRADLVCRPCEP